MPFSKFLPLFILILCFGCTESNGQTNGDNAAAKPTSSQSKLAPTKPAPLPEAFNDYWFSGEAELTRYALSQSRYGEIHEGDAVLIFVTEDFRTDRQVKYEGGSREGVAPILKLNFTRKFITGIYPYSMMTSVFSPVNYNQPTLKTSTTSQEWCGHTFDQLNYRNGGYEGQLRSYFQEEGDREYELPAAVLEDGLWTTLRLNPEALPTGEIEVIPSATFLRLRHLEHQVMKATATLSEVENAELSDQPLRQYRLAYQGIPRVLEITFERAFPHTIVAWSEQDQSLTTRAVRTHSIKSPYWSKNGNQDRALRKELGLE